ncbi:unnamed protein product [Lymnaea stagnalis]|uniref:L-Fucosyltransferase n=1 Tax=Lymnaea stagnalis TaxID=6523 RepID=A0AAV2HKP7_LYMST
MTATFFGGQGNQLFVYASLLGIAKAHNRTAFIRRGTILERVFEITHVNNNISTNGWVPGARLTSNSDRMREKMFAAFETRLMNVSKENITLVGCMQVWRYFTNIEDEIRRELTFLPHLRKQISGTLGKFRNQFEGNIIVGVHVRRGDFLSSENVKKGYGVANASYFVKAFARMRSMLNGANVTFIVASDDLTWCHANLNSPDVQILAPGSSMWHFGVLANCDHVIMSGGTYGWWAAWLADGITIYYQKYLVKGTWLFRGVNLQDYYPAKWVPLGD